jgi:hypothetical protein
VVESRPAATTIEPPKHLGRFDEGIAAIGFYDPRLDLPFGVLVQVALIIFDDHDRDPGASGNEASCLSTIAPS